LYVSLKHSINLTLH